MTPERRVIERKLENYILEELLDQPHDGRDPLATGAVDSLGQMQLVEYIEGEFGVKLGDEDMVWKNFKSIPTLAAFVDSKRDGAGP